MPPLTMAQALRRALRDALAEDERVVVLGEDVGRLGGVFRITEGLAATFGEQRCFDTPVSESGIVGLAIGMAMAGYRPVVEMQFDAFGYPAFEQVASHVAKMNNRTRGALPLPLVIRVPYGGGIGGVEHHSDSSEAYYAHTAGLKVAAPATPADAYSLLREAIEDPDPVVFLEPKRHYWSKAETELPVRTGRFGNAAIRRPGADATLVAHGPAVSLALDAAQQACARGWDVEVLDMRTIVPLDDTALMESVRRTGRCVVVQEAPGFASVASEIAARVQEHCHDTLQAPVLRVTGFDIPYPPPLLEDAHLPGVPRVLDALGRVLAGVARSPRPTAAAAVTAAPAEGESVFRLPDLGEGLGEAEVLEWKVAVGDLVAVDQVVAEVETAKSAIAVPTPFAGTVTRLHRRAGEILAVGEPLLTVRPAAQDQAADRQPGSGAVLTGYGTRRAAPRPDASGPPEKAGTDRSRRTRLAAAARTYERAHREIPAVTIWRDADVTGLAGRGLLAACAALCLSGLAEHPELNSRVDADRAELVHPSSIHLSFATQTDRGLLTPVIRDAQLLSREHLAEELRRLTTLARGGTLPAAHATGGTFTINNYGPLKVDGATPLLNHPQTAMLGIGRVLDRPWAVQGRLEVRKVVQLSLTFDHRVCDGATAAAFLTHVADRAEAVPAPV